MSSVKAIAKWREIHPYFAFYADDALSFAINFFRCFSKGMNALTIVGEVGE
jgi:hypothetical protein